MHTSTQALHVDLAFGSCRQRISSMAEWPYQPGRDFPVGRLILFLRHVALGSLLSDVLVQCEHVCSCRQISRLNAITADEVDIMDLSSIRHHR